MTECPSTPLPVIALLLIFFGVMVGNAAGSLVNRSLQQTGDRVAARRFAEKLGIEYLELLRKRDGGGGYQI